MSETINPRGGEQALRAVQPKPTPAALVERHYQASREVERARTAYDDLDRAQRAALRPLWMAREKAEQEEREARKALLADLERVGPAAQEGA